MGSLQTPTKTHLIECLLPESGSSVNMTEAYEELKKCSSMMTPVAVRNSYTGRFTVASIWEILSLAVLLARGPRRTSTHQLAEH